MSKFGEERADPPKTSNMAVSLTPLLTCPFPSQTLNTWITPPSFKVSEVTNALKSDLPTLLSSSLSFELLLFTLHGLYHGVSEKSHHCHLASSACLPPSVRRRRRSCKAFGLRSSDEPTSVRHGEDDHRWLKNGDGEVWEDVLRQASKRGFATAFWSEWWIQWDQELTGRTTLASYLCVP